HRGDGDGGDPRGAVQEQDAGRGESSADGEDSGQVGVRVEPGHGLSVSSWGSSGVRGPPRPHVATLVHRGSVGPGKAATWGAELCPLLDGWTVLGEGGGEGGADHGAESGSGPEAGRLHGFQLLHLQLQRNLGRLNELLNAVLHRRFLPFVALFGWDSGTRKRRIMKCRSGKKRRGWSSQR